MSSANRRTHHDLALPRQLILFVTALAAVQELHRLLRALICVNLHAFFATYAADDSGLLRAAVISQTILATEVRRWKLAIAVRVLRFVLVE